MFDLTLTSLLARALAGAIGLTLHEFAHAWVAYRLGDNTAQRQGRLTLNPRAHLDPFGYILVVIFGFGWARPVPVSPWRLRYGPRVGNAIVAAAGPLTNLLIAVVFAIPLRLAFLGGTRGLPLQLLWAIVVLNVVLFVFNLIPLAPLDGASVLSGIVGARAARTLAPLQMYGPQILMGLMLLGFLSPRLNILGALLSPVIGGVTRVVLGT